MDGLLLLGGAFQADYLFIFLMSFVSELLRVEMSQSCRRILAVYPTGKVRIVDVTQHLASPWQTRAQQQEDWLIGGSYKKSKKWEKFEKLICLKLVGI